MKFVRSLNETCPNSGGLDRAWPLKKDETLCLLIDHANPTGNCSNVAGHESFTTPISDCERKPTEETLLIVFFGSVVLLMWTLPMLIRAERSALSQYLW